MSKMKKECIITVVVLLLCAVIALWVAPAMYRMYTEHREKVHAEELKEAKVEYPFLDDTVVIHHYQGKDYYVGKKPYQGEYNEQSLMYVRLSKEDLEAYEVEGWLGELDPGAEERRLEQHIIAVGEFEVREDNDRSLQEAEVLQVMDYEEYVDYCEEWRLQQTYTDPELKYIVRSTYNASGMLSTFSGVEYEDSVAVLYFVEQKSNLPDIGLKTYIIPTDQDVDTAEVVQIYSEEEYENILEFGQTINPNVVD